MDAIIEKQMDRLIWLYYQKCSNNKLTKEEQNEVVNITSKSELLRMFWCSMYGRYGHEFATLHKLKYDINYSTFNGYYSR